VADSVKFSKPFSLVRARVIVKLNASFQEIAKILDYPSERHASQKVCPRKGLATSNFPGQL
jgi:hypothetical protein